MLDVILGFARLDTALAARLSQAVGMPLDRGALLVENMDIAVKMTRLKKVCTHDGDAIGAEFWGKAKKIYETHKDVRNTIAHATYVGTRKTDPDTAVFSPIRAAIGTAGQLQVYLISTSQMDITARWAVLMAETVIKDYEQHEGPLERLGD